MSDVDTQKYQHILVEYEGRVAFVTMNRPQRRNALSLEHMQELLACFKEIGERRDAGAVVLRGNGLAGANGWPNSPRLETLREEWFQAPDEASERRIATEMQRVALEEVIFIPLGAYTSKTAIKKSLSGRIPGLPVFWNLKG